MENKVVIYTSGEEETAALGAFIGSHAVDGLFLALTGDLGAGKTHFVQGLAKGMGIEGVIGSPTFTIMNYYDGPVPLKHFDFYRLESEEDLWNIGWEEYSMGGVVVVEWADMFPSLIPEEGISIQISLTGPTERDIEITWGEDSPKEVVKEIQNYASRY